MNHEYMREKERGTCIGTPLMADKVIVGIEVEQNVNCKANLGVLHSLW